MNPSFPLTSTMPRVRSTRAKALAPRPLPRSLARLSREVLQLHLNSLHLSTTGTSQQPLTRLRRATRPRRAQTPDRPCSPTTPPPGRQSLRPRSSERSDDDHNSTDGESTTNTTRERKPWLMYYTSHKSSQNLCLSVDGLLLQGRPQVILLTLNRLGVTNLEQLRKY